VAQIGFVGLGRMGGNMVARIKRDSDHDVVAYDRDAATVKGIAERTGARGARSLSDLISKLEPPRMVWIMVPHGKPTQDTVDKLATLMDKADLIVDGGNSKWTEDRERAAALRKLGVHYVDVGTSGGVWGLEVGYCMMVGGPEQGVRRLAPILDVLAPETSDAGRHVLHNGIEYGLMQAYAEGFDIFDKSDFELDKAKIAHLWNQGSVVRSWLCELAARAFEQEGNDLSSLSPYTDDSGEGRWTIEDAIDKDVPTPVITASLYARFYSRGGGDFTHRVLAALRAQFGGHPVRKAGG
jgi:6-phosphogluconate dehydrogenase